MKKTNQKWHYKTVDVATSKGLKKAERLYAIGWRITSYSLDVLTFEKKI